MSVYVGASGLAARYVGSQGPSRYVGTDDRVAWDALAAVQEIIMTTDGYYGDTVPALSSVTLTMTSEGYS